MSVFHLNEFVQTNSCFIHCCRRYTNRHIADFPAIYNVKTVERDRYKVWEQSKYNSLFNSDKEPFRMILPPPNVTGILHLGHALTVVVQDVLARWYRMNGHPVVWVPGFDHAGIATQAIVEKHLYKMKGILRSDMEKEEFLSHVWNWKDTKKSIIVDQLKALGATLDWSKEYFTMDKNHNFAVTEAFVALNQKNLLYREKDLINWSPALKSAISDIEVESIEITEKTKLSIPGYKKTVTFGQIVEIAYQLENDRSQEVIVATTRPETCFGDVAIAVHPDDERYTRHIGLRVWHPLRKIFIPIIADSSVNKNFGTGAMKITPAHDELDYAISKKHQLDIINVIDEHGQMTEATGEFMGLPRFIAREKVLTYMNEIGILRNVKSHKMTIPICSRSGDVIEYLLKEQWFVKCKCMAQKALQAVENGTLKIDPPIHLQLWHDWLSNIRDWCVSRQLWWGHPIPAYHIMHEGQTTWIVARSKEDAEVVARNMYGCDTEVNQDSDVLDTWFSSALLPFTALGWPNKDFNNYYPLSLMETGHDILFFWVARMVMLGLELTGQLPFKEVLLHGVLCDANGKKMSKSLGNVISPESVINGSTLEELNLQAEKNHNMGILSKTELKRTLSVNKKMFPKGILDCGADALRMALCSHNIKSRTVTFNTVECQTNKFLCNKIWQVSKYVLLMIDDKHREPEALTTIDKWILSRLSFTVDTVNKGFQEHNFFRAVLVMKQFLYNEFCDFYVEATKWGFKEEKADVASAHIYTLAKCLEVFLRTLAPIMPYLADDLYIKLSERLPGFRTITSVLEAPYPTSQEFEQLRNESLEKRISEIVNVVIAIRCMAANVNKTTNPEVHIVTDSLDDYEFYKENVSLVKGASRMFNVSVCPLKDYVVSKNSVEGPRDIFNMNNTVYVLSEHASVLEIVKNNINKKVSSKSDSAVDDLRKDEKIRKSI